MQKFKYLILFLAFFFLFVTRVSACEPVECLMTSSNGQDTLLIGTVMYINDGLYKVHPDFVFPQTFEKIKTDINVDGSSSIKVGSKYLFSLRKNTDKYDTLWGTYEVFGDIPESTKLLKYGSLDNIAIEMFIQSKGSKTNFTYEKVISPNSNQTNLKLDGKVVATENIDIQTNIKTIYYGDTKVAEFQLNRPIPPVLYAGGTFLILLVIFVVNTLRKPVKRK